ncbi:propanediol utilization microcompartment protein PduB [Clostridium boliviensis]|uniref:Propanediol utilization microcompartment protein PduB n=1 Tax=Clostridium boliviensis TaxID=318465 RepID=A0ABU4GM57_9CLOT|nr:propanediol utilization microcompartment protein PduB [Clostridium boliviensis]MDW2798043.1 propanediol utilization microcompartment protein PduB [Clostridium boliviensis]
MDKDLLDKILSSVTGSENKEQTTEKVETAALTQCNLTEFVGAGIGDTVGLVIANLEYHLHENLKLDPKYRSIGIVSSRTGGAPHVMSADEAVKATNTEVVSVEFCRDTKGGAGHGSTIIFAAEDVSDARRAVEIMLSSLDTNFGNVYGCDAGHIELHYTARASYALNKAFNAPIGKAFGITVGAPAAVGLLMADMAMKTANVDIVTYASPASGTCFSNEIIVTFSGDSGAVRQSVLAARDVGLSVLRGMGQNPVSVTTPTL